MPVLSPFSRWRQRILHPGVISKYVSEDTSLGKNIQIMDNSHVAHGSVIGSWTYIGYSCFISAAHIGNYCSIGNNVSIGPGEHTLDAVSTSTLFTRDPLRTLLAKPMHVGHDVWIGANAVIRRGFVIGNGAVIGANAVVTSDIEPYGIYAGVPARLIRMRFDPETIAKIESSQWWLYPPDEAQLLWKKIGILRQ